MATTITVDQNLTAKIGNKLRTGGTGNLGATYSTRGTVSANDFGLGALETLDIEAGAGYVFRYDSTGTQIDAYEAGTASAALDECDANDDLSAVTFNWTATGV